MQNWWSGLLVQVLHDGFILPLKSGICRHGIPANTKTKSHFNSVFQYLTGRVSVIGDPWTWGYRKRSRKMPSFLNLNNIVGSIT